MKAEDLLVEMDRRHVETLDRSWKQYPRRACIASDLPDCDRQMALSMLAWKERPKPDTAGLERMQSGRGMEDVVLADLRAEGWKIVQEQSPFEVRDRKGRLIISGKSEGKLVIPGDDHRALRSIELKDTSQYVFDALLTEDDLRTNMWTVKWWRQMQIYMLDGNEEWMVLIVTHRRRRRNIIVHLDYAEAERILQRCEKAMDAYELMQQTPADQLDSELTAFGLAYHDDQRSCRACDFFQRVCFPQLRTAQSEDVIEKPELEPIVARYVEIEEIGKEKDRLERKLFTDATKGVHIAAGQFLITGHWEEQNTKPTPEIPAQAAKPAGKKKVWRKSVIKL